MTPSYSALMFILCLTISTPTQAKLIQVPDSDQQAMYNALKRGATGVIGNALELTNAPKNPKALPYDPSRYFKLLGILSETLTNCMWVTTTHSIRDYILENECIDAQLTVLQIQREERLMFGSVVTGLDAPLSHSLSDTLKQLLNTMRENDASLHDEKVMSGYLAEGL